MLTDAFIKNVKPADKPKKYADGGGLFLYVPVSGSKLWRMAYRYNHKSKLLSFGSYPTVSLKMARDSVKLDTSELDIDGVIAAMKEIIARKVTL